MLHLRGLPPKKDPHWSAEARNRDIIDPHKDSIRASFVKNGLANSQVLYAVAWGVKSREEAYRQAVAAEKGEKNAAGKPHVFTLLGGNHQWVGCTEAVGILEKTNPDQAKEIRVLKVNVIAYPPYSDKTDDGREKIVRELRDVSLHSVITAIEGIVSLTA